MKKKFTNMAESVEYSIQMIKGILENYDTRLSLTDDEDELKELKHKRAFMQEQLEDQENLYAKYKLNNEPYYEPNTYEYFKNELNNAFDKNFDFVNEVLSFVNDDIKPSKKVKILKELVKAYKDTEEVK